MVSPTCYSRRRLNPFRGVEQVLDTAAGRAVSTDGLNWELQLYVARPPAWGSLNTAPQRDLARFGVWSEAEGMARFPRFPPGLTDPTQVAADLIATLRGVLPDLPFALTDRVEAWLCRNGQPVALLASAASLPSSRVTRPWQALPDDAEAAGLNALLASLHGQTLWFERLADGSGRQFGAGATLLPAADFPELLLQPDVFDDEPAAQLHAYLDRIAPRLLTLPLDPATRARLEAVAAADANGVAHFFRLYPDTIDTPLITRLRVEARLRLAAA